MSMQGTLIGTILMTDSAKSHTETCPGHSLRSEHSSPWILRLLSILLSLLLTFNPTWIKGFTFRVGSEGKVKGERWWRDRHLAKYPKRDKEKWQTFHQRYRRHQLSGVSWVSMSTLQIGHFLLVASHWSTQAWWKRCMQGNLLVENT